MCNFHLLVLSSMTWNGTSRSGCARTTDNDLDSTISSTSLVAVSVVVAVICSRTIHHSVYGSTHYLRAECEFLVGWWLSSRGPWRFSIDANERRPTRGRLLLCERKSRGLGPEFASAVPPCHTTMREISLSAPLKLPTINERGRKRVRTRLDRF